MSEANARLAISLLGPYRVTLDGQPVTGFVSDKARALLAYLAVEAEREHSRARLIGLLWPDYPERNARASLRTALADVRSEIGDRTSIPPFLDISRQTLQFNAASSVWLDVEAFDTLLEDPNAFQSTDRPGVQRLQKAIELYQGEFLEGFSLPDCAAYEEWVLMNRERLHRKVLEALHRLTEYHEQFGEYDLALRYARRQLELDLLRETAHRQVMRLLALSGKRVEALAQYEVCCEALRNGLGVEPDGQTTALYEQIRTGKLERSSPSECLPAPALPVSDHADSFHSRTAGSETLRPGASSAGQSRQRSTLKKPITVITIAVLCLAVGLIIWILVRPPPPLESPLAVMASTEAHVEVKRANTRQVILASFGMPLYSGDVVYTHDQAAATIICCGGLTYILDERKSLTIDCEQIADTQIRVVWLDPALVDQSDLMPTPTGEGLPADETRASRGVQEAMPLLLSPRNTVITDTRPSFHWQPVVAASSYRLSIAMPTEEHWSAETPAESLFYPAAEPSLKPGSLDNIVRVDAVGRADGQDTSDVTQLSILDEGNAQSLALAEKAIQDLDLDAVAKGYLLVQIYQDYEMWDSAIHRLEKLTEERDIASAYLLQLTGDLYFRVELYALAEEHYRAAMATAETSDDKIAQAAAIYGLARTSYAYGEVEMALVHLEGAAALYRQTGQVEQAESVNSERIRLENSAAEP